MTANRHAELGYQINDADNDFTEPPDCFERYIDPSKADLAVRSVTGPDGRRLQLVAGVPSKFHSDQVTYSKEELAEMQLSHLSDEDQRRIMRDTMETFLAPCLV